jgi:hypothetical protein
MSAINRFLLENGLRIEQNPCISPDFCLDWASLSMRLRQGTAQTTPYPQSRFATDAGSFSLVEDEHGDHAWLLESQSSPEQARAVLEDGIVLGDGRIAFPASWANLLCLKNLVQEHDPETTIFPTASGTLGHQSLGVGARFTTLHWPAVEWAMAALGLSMTANQNSIPRELVYDVDAMLDGRLEGVPFAFIGCEVPEGHQGQSVEGMSHGAVLSKLKTGFWRRRIPWGFNADHQPIGGKYDEREERLVEGCLLASYITFDLSPELAATPGNDSNAPDDVVSRVHARVQEIGIDIERAALARITAQLWPALLKMRRRDRLYSDARRHAFTTSIGRRYFRELSIDELPGLTTPETLATVLALTEALDVRVDFVAPAFGFEKNFPFADNAELERRVGRAFGIAKAFGVSLGFHSGSGKSETNYRIVGQVTGSRLEIKTSGRYTYEMGRALAQSRQPADQKLWNDWYRFTAQLALASAFSENAAERALARRFIAHALEREGKPGAHFDSPESVEAALGSLSPSPEHMFWFEYNFLFVLAAAGRADKLALGDHGPAGYRQRARFYALSREAQLGYARNVAEYLCFLAETTGMASAVACQSARDRLAEYASLDRLIADIAPPELT